MSDVTQDDIGFIQFHLPPLKSGEYTLDLNQHISVPDSKGFPQDSPFFENSSKPKKTAETYSQTKRFFVAGDRFTIRPQEIHIQFPPPNNGGDHTNVLPHIILNRSTLPWERDADPEDSELPWLWLFIYDDQDIASGVVQLPERKKLNTVVSFLDPKSSKPLSDSGKGCVPLYAEPDENLQASVNVVKVKKDWLQQENIIPSSAALKMLTSVRKNISKDGEKIEWSVCVANRMPMAGGNSYAHLVTLENRFKSGTFDFENGLDSDGNIHFVSLAHWQFSCPDDVSYQCTQKNINKLTQAGVSQKLINAIQTLPAETLYAHTFAMKEALASVMHSKLSDLYQKVESTILACLKIPSPTFKGLLDQVNRGNLQRPILEGSSQAFKAANQYIQRGAVPLPHELRNGGDTVSWYHGPLIDGTDPDVIGLDALPLNLPVTSSDQLLRFDTQIGMFDVSYAAAWELGRLLMLENRTLAMQLYAWKRQHAWDLKQQEQALLYGHLPFSEQASGAKADSDHGQRLGNWFHDLNLLHNVPFNYLVAEENLLPDESIRFFTLDNLWIECLMDGAFSIGRVTSADCSRDSLLAEKKSSVQYPNISGLLLRSEVVSGWPGLQVSASSIVLNDLQIPEKSSPVNIIRMERLSPNILLCLFDDLVKTVDVHLAAESLHFGFDRPFEDHKAFYKELKSLDTGEIIYDKNKTPGKHPTTVDISWLLSKVNSEDRNRRVVDVELLSDHIATTLGKTSKDFTSAQFALEMIEGVPRIRFKVDVKSTSTGGL